jgi:hypothetical protein
MGEIYVKQKCMKHESKGVLDRKVISQVSISPSTFLSGDMWYL